MSRSKRNPPNPERKRRMHYTEKDDLDMIHYFLERYRAGDPLAHRKQPRKLFEPYTKAKGWKQLPLAVESHFRRHVIMKKLFDLSLSAGDFFILAYHFNLPIPPEKKQLLEQRYDCTVNLNEHGELSSAYDKNGEPLHLRVLAEGERPEEAAELWAQSMGRRGKTATVSRRDSDSDISSICSGAENSEGEDEEESTLQPTESTTVIYDHFHTVSPNEMQVKEEPMSDQEMTEDSDSLVEPVDISRPNSGDPANKAFQNGGTRIEMESSPAPTKNALKERYAAVIRGDLPPGMLDDIPLLKGSKGCSKMIQMLKNMLITINTGTEEDFKQYDRKHGLVKNRLPNSPRAILTHRSSQGQVAPQDVPNNIAMQLTEPMQEYEDDQAIQNDIENSAEGPYMASTEAAVPDFSTIPEEFAANEELVQNKMNLYQYEQELPASTPNSRGPYHRPECRPLFDPPNNGMQNVPNQAHRVPIHPYRKSALSAKPKAGPSLHSTNNPEVQQLIDSFYAYEDILANYFCPQIPIQ